MKTECNATLSKIFQIWPILPSCKDGKGFLSNVIIIFSILSYFIQILENGLRRVTPSGYLGYFYNMLSIITSKQLSNKS